MKLSEKLHKLFLGFSEYHGEFKPNTSQQPGEKVKGVPVTKPGSGTPDLWDNHLDGRQGLGIIPLLDDDTLMFAGIDIDVYDLEHSKIEEKIAKAGFPLWLFRSKSGGTHLYLFLSEPISAKSTLESLRYMAASLGFGSSEIFPKHHTRSSETRISNWLNMPYFNGRHSIDACYSPCMYRGKWINAEEFVEAVWDKRVSKEQLSKFNVQKEYFPDGPPCLNLLASNGVSEFKNNYLFNVAVYYKQAFPESWESKLYVARDQLLDGSGSRQEIENIIKQVGKKDVKYMCKEPPVCDVCNRMSCSTKKYGVAALGDKGWVLLDGLTKLIDPCGGEASYVVNANGVPVWLGACADLLRQQKFQEIVFDKANVLMPLVKKDEWETRVRGLLEAMQEIVLPTEATSEGMVFEYLKEFVDSNSRNVETLQDISMGRVFIESVQSPNSGILIKTACFRAPSFFEFLKSRGFRALETRKIFRMFSIVNAKKSQMNVGGKNIQYWKIGLKELSAIVDNEINLGDYNFTQIPSSIKKLTKETILQEEEYSTPDVSRKF